MRFLFDFCDVFQNFCLGIFEVTVYFVVGGGHQDAKRFQYVADFLMGCFLTDEDVLLDVFPNAFKFVRVHPNALKTKLPILTTVCWPKSITYSWSGDGKRSWKQHNKFQHFDSVVQKLGEGENVNECMIQNRAFYNQVLRAQNEIRRTVGMETCRIFLETNVAKTKAWVFTFIHL